MRFRYSLAGKRIFIAGHGGLVGGALVRALNMRGDCVLLTASRADLDLLDQQQVHDWFVKHRPDVVIMAAGRVGGIGANAAMPASFAYENSLMALNVINSSYLANVNRLIYLGSSCIYSPNSPLPLRPDNLLCGQLEETNRGYAMAKLMGIELCRSYRSQYGCDFISALPCNLYGVGDRFDEQNSHVIPALMMKAHRAKIEGLDHLPVWGSGYSMREFLHADDLAQAILLLLERYNGNEPVNIGLGHEISIKDLANEICHATGFGGRIEFDPTQPDGVMSKIMHSRVIYDMGWSPRVDLKSGLKQMYRWYCDEYLQQDGEPLCA